MRTVMIVVNGVTMQYDQKIVRDMRRSNASPDALCVIWANVRAGGDANRRTFTTTKIGLSPNGSEPQQSLYKRWILTLQTRQ